MTAEELCLLGQSISYLLNEGISDKSKGLAMQHIVDILLPYVINVVEEQNTSSETTGDADAG